MDNLRGKELNYETKHKGKKQEGSWLMNNLSNASFLCYVWLVVHFGSYHIAPIFKEPLPIQIAKKDKGKGKETCIG